MEEKNPQNQNLAGDCNLLEEEQIQLQCIGFCNFAEDVCKFRMKGKGKTANDKDCPLQFPDLEPVDHVTQCLKYSNSKFHSKGGNMSLSLYLYLF